MASSQVPEGYKQTEVGVIPEDWEATTVGSLASFTSGGGINMATLSPHSSDTPIPVYGGNGIAGYTNRFLTEESTVVLGRVGQKCGEVYLTEGPAWITDNALYSYLIFRKLNIHFLSLALKAAGLNDFRNRNDLPLVTQEIVHSAKIALPSSVEEQNAIATTLSDIDALIAKLDKLIAKKRHLKTATMQQLLTGKKRLPGFGEGKGYQQTEVGVIPEDWKEVTVEDIKALTENALATGPFGSSISAQFFQEDGVPVIRGSNLSQDIGTKLSDEGLVFVSPQKAIEFRRSVVRKGDLIFTCWGTINQIGLIDEQAQYAEYIISNKQMKFTPNHHQANSLFLYYLFSGPEIQNRIKNQNIGSSVPGFNLGQLRELRFALPSLLEQNQITTVLSDIDTEITALETRRTKTQSIKQGMMQELLTGRTRLV